MELKDFIKKTLLDIHAGVSEANKYLASEQGKTLGQDFSSVFMLHGFGDHNNGKNYMTFDIAIKLSKETSEKGTGGVDVVVASLDGELSSTDKNENYSRVKFNVFI